MPYGYLGQNAPNQTVSNSGVFDISSAASLEKQGKFGGSLELIEEKSISASSSAIFTDIKETKYDTHFLTMENLDVSDNNYAVQIRFFESGVEETGNVYEYAYAYGDTNGTYSGYQSTGNNFLLTGLSIGNGTYRAGQSFTTFYNLGNSSLNSGSVTQAMGQTGLGYARFTWGGGQLTQASTVDQIKLFVTSGTFSCTAKLYGEKK